MNRVKAYADEHLAFRPTIERQVRRRLLRDKVLGSRRKRQLFSVRADLPDTTPCVHAAPLQWEGFADTRVVTYDEISWRQEMLRSPTSAYSRADRVMGRVRTAGLDHVGAVKRTEGRNPVRFRPSLYKKGKKRPDKGMFIFFDRFLYVNNYYYLSTVDKLYKWRYHLLNVLWRR